MWIRRESKCLVPFLGRSPVRLSIFGDCPDCIRRRLEAFGWGVLVVLPVLRHSGRLVFLHEKDRFGHRSLYRLLSACRHGRLFGNPSSCLVDAMKPGRIFAIATAGCCAAYAIAAAIHPELAVVPVKITLGGGVATRHVAVVTGFILIAAVGAGFTRNLRRRAVRRGAACSGLRAHSRARPAAGFGYGRMTSVAGAVLARREGSYMASAWAGGRTKVPAETACAT